MPECWRNQSVVDLLSHTLGHNVGEVERSADFDGDDWPVGHTVSYVVVLDLDVFVPLVLHGVFWPSLEKNETVLIAIVSKY